MWYIKEDIEPKDAVVYLGLWFVRPWLLMLALGGEGVTGKVDNHCRWQANTFRRVQR
jgi:hypothetical protein